MKKLLTVLLAASMALATTYAAAEEAKPAKPTAKKTEKKAVKKPAKKAAAVKDEDEVEPDVAGSEISEYSCEHGHTITVYRNAADTQYAAMRWDKRLYRMKRVETESGAERLEHAKRGLLFIGIPAKAMLLDSKKGRQLANECKMPGQ